MNEDKEHRDPSKDRRKLRRLPPVRLGKSGQRRSSDASQGSGETGRRNDSNDDRDTSPDKDRRT